eukprot:255078-Amphidinium_carterae.1
MNVWPELAAPDLPSTVCACVGLPRKSDTFSRHVNENKRAMVSFCSRLDVTSAGKHDLAPSKPSLLSDKSRKVTFTCGSLPKLGSQCQQTH